MRDKLNSAIGKVPKMTYPSDAYQFGLYFLIPLFIVFTVHAYYQVDYDISQVQLQNILLYLICVILLILAFFLYYVLQKNHYIDVLEERAKELAYLLEDFGEQMFRPDEAKFRAGKYGLLYFARVLKKDVLVTII